MRKIYRESWLPTLLIGVAVFAFQFFVTQFLPQFIDEGAGQFLEIPFVQAIVNTLLGADPGSSIGPRLMSSISWVHPVMLALLCAHGMIICSRTPAAEIDRGTVDVLLSLPISRWQLYRTETAGWLLAGVSVIAMGVAGCWLGHQNLIEDLRPNFGRILMVASNALALYTAVGALVLLVSARSDRRGAVFGWCFAVVLGSFFLNFLVQFWEPARHVAFLGFLNYYRPLEVLETGAYPTGDVAVLFIVAACFWTTGGWIFARRDICTV